jgi:hypothetical protein
MSKSNSVSRFGIGRFSVLAVVGLLIVGAGIAGGVSSASAAPRSTSSANSDQVDVAYFQAWLARYNVDAPTRARLIEKLKSGQLWDSMKAGAIPVSQIHRSTSSEDISVATFTDGSIVVSSIEKPTVAAPGVIVPYVIGGCTVSSGTGFSVFTGCTISQDSGTVLLTFKASYEKYTGGAKIDSATNPTVVAHYGSASSPTLVISPAVSYSTATPAVATEHSHFTASNGSEDLYLSLRVTTAQAWTTTY